MAPVDILVIDDDKDLSLLVKSMLVQAGYRVECLDSGKRALQLLRQKHLESRLILLDIEMPEMSGYEVCEALQEDSRLALIPVIMMTASLQVENRLQAFQLGAVGFLNKPLTPNILVEQVKKALMVEQQWKSNFVPQSVPKTPVSTNTQTPAPLPPASSPTETSVTPINDTPETHIIAEKPASPVKETQLVPRSPEPKAAPAKDRNSFAAFCRYLESTLPNKDVLLELKPDNIYDQLLLHGFSSNQTAGLISGFTGLPFLSQIPKDRLRLGILPMPFCRKYHLVPFDNDAGVLSFALTHPFQIEVQDILSHHRQAPQYIAVPGVLQQLFAQSHQTADAAGKSATLKPSSPAQRLNEMEDLMDELQSQYVSGTALTEENALQLEDPTSAPMIRLVNKLIEEAYALKASDIHIEAREENVRVRYRVDGELKDYHRLTPPNLIHPLAARLKIMAQLNIAERRLPQDGRIVYKQFNRQNLDFDLRLSTAPMNHGEKVVMRILDKQKSMLPLEALGFSNYNLTRYREQLQNPYGMILHVGPTGSGKSMTLYSALNEINRDGINIQTAEDPIEYTLPNINQLQVQPGIGLTFARALRAYLRQDPDVILVGEIRDHETAHIAVEAALTGHLLLSTLHTNDAASTLTRFIEMGISPFMISPSVVMVCAQRLMRRLCEHCKTPYAASELEKKQVLHPVDQPLNLYRAVGCEKCRHTGYSGRIGIHELLIPDERLRNAMTQPNISSEALKKMAMESGMVTLYADAMEKVKQGVSSLEEARSKVKPD